MAVFTQYTPDKVIANWFTLTINGFAAETFIEIERDEDGFTKYKGVLDDTCRTRNLNTGGSVTFTLMMHAPINNDLSLYAQEDETFGNGAYPLQIKDLSGRMLVSAAEAWIKKRPKIERGKDAGTIQWVFDCAQLVIFEGGAIV